MCTRSIAKVSVSKVEHEEVAKSGTTSRPRKTSRTTPSTNAHRQVEKHFGAAGGSKMSIKCDVPQQYKRAYNVP